jgi:hypothetical protein
MNIIATAALICLQICKYCSRMERLLGMHGAKGSLFGGGPALKHVRFQRLARKNVVFRSPPEFAG